MYPVALDLTKISVLLVGKGEAFAKRKAQLEEAGATQLYSCHPGEGRDPRLGISAWLGVDASLRWHDSVIIMLAGLSYAQSKTIADAARAAGKLVNVEDVPELCDFTFTAYLRRGDLLIAVSTGGASPTLAKRVRDRIAELFGQEWEKRTEELKQFRIRLRSEGKSMKEVMVESDKLLDDLLHPERSVSVVEGSPSSGGRSLGFARDKVL